MKRIQVCFILLVGLSLISCKYLNPKKLGEGLTPSQKESAAKLSPTTEGPGSSKPDISGTYQASGTNPGGQGNYRGTVTITRDPQIRISEKGMLYQVHWEVGTVYDGEGTWDGKVFKVEWGRADHPVGVVTYTLEEDGSLKGSWYTYQNPNQLGSENLSPMGPGAI